MAFSQTQLTALEKAIAAGVTSMRIGNRQINYHSLDEMIRLRDRMKSELGVESAAGSRSRIINIATGKGL